MGSREGCLRRGCLSLGPGSQNNLRKGCPKKTPTHLYLLVELEEKGFPHDIVTAHWVARGLQKKNMFATIPRAVTIWI